MRLRRLWIGNFYKLQNVEIPFDETRSLHDPVSIRFFVGANGSGKSNALEAIGLIFSHLAAELPLDIAYELEYELRGRHIRIGNRATDKALPLLPRINAWIQVRRSRDAEWETRTEWGSSGAEVIPPRVIGYSTGPTSGLPWVLAQSIERAVKSELEEFDSNLPGSMSEVARETSLRRDELNRRVESYLESPNTLFFGADDALYAAVALLTHEGFEGPELEEYSNRRRIILNKINLDADEPLVAFTLHVAGDWQRMLTHARRERLRALMAKATVRRTIEEPQRASGAAPDFYAVFDLDEEFRRRAIREIAPTPLTFFEELLAWKRQGALVDVRLVLRKRSVEALLPESALSDGEFLFLGRYALLLMLREIPECLLLLDEPETHFNDRWKVDLVKDICDMIRPSTSSEGTEVIIATHSDLTLTDAEPSQVYVFTDEADPERAERGPSLTVRRPAISPFGANRGEITRLIFGTESAIGSYAREYLEEKLRSASAEELNYLVHNVAGPGFYRFQLRNRLAQLEECETPGEG